MKLWIKRHQIKLLVAFSWLLAIEILYVLNLDFFAALHSHQIQDWWVVFKYYGLGS